MNYLGNINYLKFFILQQKYFETKRVIVRIALAFGPKWQVWKEKWKFERRARWTPKKKNK